MKSALKKIFSALGWFVLMMVGCSVASSLVGVAFVGTFSDLSFENEAAEAKLLYGSPA
jgi:hypothetical protein